MADCRPQRSHKNSGHIKIVKSKLKTNIQISNLPKGTQPKFKNSYHKSTHHSKQRCLLPIHKWRDEVPCLLLFAHHFGQMIYGNLWKLLQVKRMCEGRQRCNIRPTSAMFGVDTSFIFWLNLSALPHIQPIQIIIMIIIYFVREHPIIGEALFGVPSGAL